MINFYYDSDYFSRIINVANGTDAHDAATVGQMNSALNNYYQKTDKISISADSSGGYFQVNDGSSIASVSIHGGSHIISVADTSGNNRISIDGGAARIVMDNTSDYNTIEMYGQDRKLQINNALNNASGAEKTVLTDASFKLNGSSISATGIVASATQNSTALITSGGVYSALNNYYRKEDFGIEQVIDFTCNLKTENFSQNERFLGVANDNFATNLPSNLTSKIGGFATNHPPRLGAFAKCEKACSRLSERFIQAMRENRAFEDIASADAGTFLRVQEKNKNVMDSLSQNAQFMAVANDNFAIVTTSKVA